MEGSPEVLTHVLA
jgi:hypothetical protein